MELQGRAKGHLEGGYQLYFQEPEEFEAQEVKNLHLQGLIWVSIGRLTLSLLR